MDQSERIPGNGIDDDHNGYIDDIHGWNFLGGKDGRNVKDDSSGRSQGILWISRTIWTIQTFNPRWLDGAKSWTHYYYVGQSKAKDMGDGTESGIDLIMLKRVVTACVKSDSILQKSHG